MLSRFACRGSNASLLLRRAFAQSGNSVRSISSFLSSYNDHVAERAEENIVPLPLNAGQVSELTELLKDPPADEIQELKHLIEERVPPGVDEAAYVKAGFLTAIAKGEATSPAIDRKRAVELLGTMQGGYNVAPLVELLEDAELGELAATQLKSTILVFDAFYDVEELAKKGNDNAKAVMQSWADAEWFLNKADVPEKISVAVFLVPGETNTDDLSPAPDAWSRPDIPLHALAMLKNPREGITNGCDDIAALKEKTSLPLAYVGDVVGTGSSRKSATNSVLWHMGDDIPYVPNKRAGGVCIGGVIAPIFYNTMEDAGALPIEMDVSALKMGDEIDVYPYEGALSKGTALMR